VFNFQSALLTINGEELTLSDLQERLSEIRLRHLAELPPEIGVRELLLMALDRHWIIEEDSGRLLVQVPEEVAA